MITVSLGHDGVGLVSSWVSESQMHCGACGSPHVFHLFHQGCLSKCDYHRQVALWVQHMQGVRKWPLQLWHACVRAHARTRTSASFPPFSLTTSPTGMARTGTLSIAVSSSPSPTASLTMAPVSSINSDTLSTWCGGVLEIFMLREQWSHGDSGWCLGGVHL